MVDFIFYINHGLKSVATIDVIPTGFYMDFLLILYKSQVPTRAGLSHSKYIVPKGT